MSDAETEILGRVHRKQYGSGDAESVNLALRALGPAPSTAPDSEDALETFLTRLATNNISVAAASSRSDAVKCIARFMYEEHNTHRVVAGNDRRLAALPWRDGGVLVRFAAAEPDDPVSISYARLGVAESGSLMLYSNRDNPASSNWLPRDHIVVMDGRDLVASYEDAWQVVRNDHAEADLPRGISFISGPSSTGDIAGHLVSGAHGPQRLHLVFIGLVPPDLLVQAGHRQASPD
ncbi:MAG: lactate utilization protein [Halieaceae bacterium]